MAQYIRQYISIRNCAILCLIGFLFISLPVKSQVCSDKIVGKKHRARRDPLKSLSYPYTLPIWGKKTTQKRFTLPLSAGLSAQYFYSNSDILIDNLSVGFNNGPMYNLEGIVRYDEVRATAASLTFRPDVWVFPFLNVYGILGKSQASTGEDGLVTNKGRLNSFPLYFVAKVWFGTDKFKAFVKGVTGTQIAGIKTEGVVAAVILILDFMEAEE